MDVPKRERRQAVAHFGRAVENTRLAQRLGRGAHHRPLFLRHALNRARAYPLKLFAK